MSNLLWKSLLLSPAVLGATIAVSSSAMAVTAPTTTEVPQPKAVAEASSARLLASLQRTEKATLPNQIAVTPVKQLVADSKPATLIAQMPTTDAGTPAAAPASTSVDTLQEVNRYSNDGKANNTVAQVTSVAQ